MLCGEGIKSSVRKGKVFWSFSLAPRLQPSEFGAASIPSTSACSPLRYRRKHLYRGSRVWRSRSLGHNRVDIIFGGVSLSRFSRLMLRVPSHTQKKEGIFLRNDEFVTSFRAAEKEANVVRFYSRSITKLLSILHSKLGSIAIPILLYCKADAALLLMWTLYQDVHISVVHVDTFPRGTLNNIKKMCPHNGAIPESTQRETLY